MYPRNVNINISPKTGKESVLPTNPSLTDIVSIHKGLHAMDGTKNHSSSSHIWTSNNIDDNFNRVDIEEKNEEPLIIQDHLRGVSNIFAPVIYMRDGMGYRKVKHAYMVDPKNNNDDDLLGNRVLSANEISAYESLFPGNNIMIPS